jgi:type 1 fimbriae regulatory protein FimE
MKPPRKLRNSAYRNREYLTDIEISQLCDAARKGLYGLRNSTLIFIMFRHGLRVGEAIALRWDQIDLVKGFMHVRRLKNGLASTHPIRGNELRMLRQILRNNPTSPYVFISQRCAPLTDRSVRHIVQMAGRNAGFGFTVHPHMLRHSTGFYLANNGHDTRAIQSYLGHANIKNTVIYTELSPNRFKDFWRD